MIAIVAGELVTDDSEVLACHCVSLDPFESFRNDALVGPHQAKAGLCSAPRFRLAGQNRGFAAIIVVKFIPQFTVGLFLLPLQHGETT